MKANQNRKAAGLLPTLGCTSGMDLLLTRRPGQGRRRAVEAEAKSSGSGCKLAAKRTKSVQAHLFRW